MAQIELVDISTIDPNPLRRLAVYPYNQAKLEALQRSIEGVGLWEGVIGRRVGNRIQLAFGHHRTEAARRTGLTSISMIIRDLSDEEMLMFLGRENLEDYNADFLVMLETWEAATEYCGAPGRAVKNSPQLVDVANLLGWTRPYSSDHGRKEEEKHQGMRINDTAEACNIAANLLKSKDINRDDLQGMTVRQAREWCAGITEEHEMLENLGKISSLPKEEVEKQVKEGKKTTSKAAKGVAKDMKEGKISTKDVRGEISGRSFGLARKARNKKKSEHALLDTHGPKIIASINKIIKDDKLFDKFTQLKKAIDTEQFTDEKDFEMLQRIGDECGYASTRFGKWEMIFTKPKHQVVKLKAITKE